MLRARYLSIGHPFESPVPPFLVPIARFLRGGSARAGAAAGGVERVGGQQQRYHGVLCVGWRHLQPQRSRPCPVSRNGAVLALDSKAFTVDPPPTGTIPAAITDLATLQYLSVRASLSHSLFLSSRLHHVFLFPCPSPVPLFILMPLFIQPASCLNLCHTMYFSALLLSLILPTCLQHPPYPHYLNRPDFNQNSATFPRPPPSPPLFVSLQRPDVRHQPGGRHAIPLISHPPHPPPLIAAPHCPSP
ncbi:unnamed protein product [Closterium sp. Naga37s-1]|nr:unnamed protein product [Closterium sp. Naga37s-1]